MPVPESVFRDGGASRGRVLITGGAGFVGSHLADELLRHGYRVRVFDNLDPQVHGRDREWPTYLDPDIECVRGDVRDADALHDALRGVDAVFHFAAAVGVGQSMYQIERYTDVNNRGTAVLLELLSRAPVERLVVASSMSLYGEGLYCDDGGNLIAPPERSRNQLSRGEWDVRGANGETLVPLVTPESKAPHPASVYALSKLDQEKLCLMIGAAYGIPTVALRFFNIYGTRQALSNPYTGVLAIFAARYLNDRPPVVFEDGMQRRDFVSVHDVARACRLALEAPGAPGHAINIGSGRAATVLEIAAALGAALGRSDVEPDITRQFRVGDIRHCFADISLARTLLDYAPRISLQQGLEELVEWIRTQEAKDQADLATSELTDRGLRL
ncbi:MAG TPA: NAD-dependent epimerase/dehydratase family protein [Rhodanobacteraceae bacterium]